MGLALIHAPRARFERNAIPGRSTNAARRSARAVMHHEANNGLNPLARATLAILPAASITSPAPASTDSELLD